MTTREAFGNAVSNLRAHKLRSALTMLGMVFGVGAVIAMLAIGAGGERQALEIIERLGTRNVILRARNLRPEERAEIRKKSPGLSPRDGEAIFEAVPGVELVAPKVEIKPYKVLAAGTKAEARVYGVSHRLAETARVGLAEGRFLDARDEATHAQVCLVGEGVRRDLFGWGEAVGQLLKVNDLWLEVVGVLGKEGGIGGSVEGVQVAATDREIWLPVSTALRKLDRDPLDSPLDELLVRLRADVSPRTTAPLVRELVDRLHSGAADWDLVVPEALLEQSRKTQRLFRLVMGCIAGISLLVGGIGITNIMLATVLERVREIGVRRAVGATRREIRNQFVVEAFAIAAIGGGAGILLGVAIAAAVSLAAGWPTIVTPGSILLATGVSVAVGLASGIYPATRAAALDPIEALRYE